LKKRIKKMYFFDSHCHLQDERLKDNLQNVIDNALESGVRTMVCCGTSEKDWENVLLLYKQYHPYIIPSFGLHPWYCDRVSEEWFEILEQYLTTVPSAAGECGLDFLNLKINRTVQLDIFKKQYKLAQKMQRPVNIHCRGAFGALLQMLKEEGKMSAGGCIHSYSGQYTLVQEFEKLGFYISFSASVTNPDNKKVKKAVIAVSDEYLLLETDSPDILPYNLRGIGDVAVNVPANIIYTARVVAEIRETSVENIAEITERNSIKLFSNIHV